MSPASLLRVISLVNSFGFELSSTREVPDSANLKEYTWTPATLTANGQPVSVPSPAKTFSFGTNAFGFGGAINNGESLADMKAQVRRLTQTIREMEVERDALRD